jgi:hypothetical protein
MAPLTDEKRTRPRGMLISAMWWIWRGRGCRGLAKPQTTNLLGNFPGRHIRPPRGNRIR